MESGASPLYSPLLSFTHQISAIEVLILYKTIGWKYVFPDKDQKSLYVQIYSICPLQGFEK